MVKILWFFLGGSSLGLGVLGVFLPLLPTVPFLLLAAYAFSNSSDKMHNWLLNHRFLGPSISDWNQNRVIRKRAKIAAITAMLASIIATLVFGVAYKYVLAQALILGFVGRFIWRQKES